MKILHSTILMVIAILPNQAQAEIIEAKTEGACSPIFINVSSPTPIKIDCGIDTGKIQAEINNNHAVRELVSTISTIKSLRLDAIKLSKESQKNTVATKNNTNQISRLKNEFSSLQLFLNQENRLLENQIKAVDTELREILNSFNAKISPDDLDRVRVEIHEEADNKINEVSRIIQSEIMTLDIRINKVESDVSYLMTEYLNGNFKDTISFVGLEITPIQIGHDTGGIFSIEYESLAPSTIVFDKKFSIFASVGYQNLNITGSYKTTPGAPPIQTEKSNSGPFAKVGWRAYSTQFDTGVAYFSSSFGIIRSGRPLPFASLGLGFEYFRKSMRAAFELDIGIKKVNYSSLKFELAGSSSYAPNLVKSSGFIGLGFRTSFR